MGMPTTRENIKDRNSSMLPIDLAKFDEKVITALIKNGYSLEDFSKECGYAKGYMSNVKHNRVISKPMAFFIETKFGIKYAEYKYEEQKPKAKVVPKEEPKEEVNGDLFELIQRCAKVLDGIEYELISIGRKLDDLKISSELNTDILDDIKDNTSRIKPYATLTKEQD